MAYLSCMDFKLCQWMHQGTLSGVAALRYMVLCTRYKPRSLVHLFSSHSLKIRPNSQAFPSALMKSESILKQQGGCKSEEMTLTVDLVDRFGAFQSTHRPLFCHNLYSSWHKAARALGQNPLTSNELSGLYMFTLLKSCFFENKPHNFLVAI